MFQAKHTPSANESENSEASADSHQASSSSAGAQHSEDDTIIDFSDNITSLPVLQQDTTENHDRFTHELPEDVLQTLRSSDPQDISPEKCSALTAILKAILDFFKGAIASYAATPPITATIGPTPYLFIPVGVFGLCNIDAILTKLASCNCFQKVSVDEAKNWIRSVFYEFPLYSGMIYEFLQLITFLIIQVFTQYPANAIGAILTTPTGLIALPVAATVLAGLVMLMKFIDCENDESCLNGLKKAFLTFIDTSASAATFLALFYRNLQIITWSTAGAIIIPFSLFKVASESMSDLWTPANIINKIIASLDQLAIATFLPRLGNDIYKVIYHFFMKINDYVDNNYAIVMGGAGVLFFLSLMNMEYENKPSNWLIDEAKKCPASIKSSLTKCGLFKATAETAPLLGKSGRQVHPSINSTHVEEAQRYEIQSIANGPRYEDNNTDCVITIPEGDAGNGCCCFNFC